MADEENPYGRRAAPTDEPRPGEPRITVTPREEENPYGAQTRSRPGDRVRELIAEQNKMSWPAWLNQGAGDFTASSADMASFGMRPRLDAATGVATGTYPDYATGLEEELKQARVRSERSPIATAVGNVAGGVAGGISAGATKLGANIAGRALPYVPASLAKALGFGTEAGLVGGGQAAGHTYSGNFDDYWKNATEGFATAAPIGAVLGPLTPTSAVKMRPGDPRTGQAIREPSNAELLARSDNGYQTLAKIPVTYPGSHLQGQLSAAESQMITQNVAPEQAHTVFAIINRVRNHPGSISPAQIDGIRQSLNNMKNGTAPGSEKAGVAAGILRDALDDMIQHGAQASSNPVLGQQAAQWVTQARGDRAAMFRSQQLTDAATNAALKNQTGGPPVGEQLVGKGLKLLETKKGQQPNTRGWVPEERDALAAAITPTLPERAANVVGANQGKVAAGVGGVLGTIGGGTGGGIAGVGGGPAGILTGIGAGSTAGGAAGTAAGYGLGRLASDFSARGIQRRWEEVAAQMRQRSPSYERATQGSVPIAGPGQGWLPQAIQGAGASQLATPYDDGREALVPSMMRQFSY
jgi:hypothetical protein